MNGTKAIAIGPAVPFVLKGNAPVSSWAPSSLPMVDDDFMSRVSIMYEQDPLLSKALEEAKMNNDDSGTDMKGSRGSKAFVSMISKAAEFLSQPDGFRIASIDIGGWDTHANQGTEKGRLANNMNILSEGITSFKAGIGNEWKNTAVLAITEFGRTVRANGSGGTDHGTGSVAFLMGGNVNGGRMIGEWPGLSRLYQDRDLYPANDTRSLLKSTLNQHLGIDNAALSVKIFPDSINLAEYRNLFI
jgi:uncharacterized protein (DUF1501 family)